MSADQTREEWVAAAEKRAWAASNRASALQLHVPDLTVEEQTDVLQLIRGLSCDVNDLSKDNRAVSQGVAPAFPFKVDTAGIECLVCQVTPEEVVKQTNGESDEAYVGTGYSYEPVIKMREYDERVLLHEVLHVVCRRNRELLEKWFEHGDIRGAEEGLVRAVTAALFGMGWRWKVRDRSVEAQERDNRRAYAAKAEAELELAASQERERTLREMFATFYVELNAAQENLIRADASVKTLSARAHYVASSGGQTHQRQVLSEENSTQEEDLGRGQKPAVVATEDGNA